MGESCLILSRRCWARHVRDRQIGVIHRKESSYMKGPETLEGWWGPWCGSVLTGAGQEACDRRYGVWAIERTSQNCVLPGLLLLKSSAWLTSLRVFWSQPEVSHTCLFSWMSEWVCLNIDVTDQVCSLLCDTRRGPLSYSGHKLEFLKWQCLLLGINQCISLDFAENMEGVLTPKALWSWVLPSPHSHISLYNWLSTPFLSHRWWS